MTSNDTFQCSVITPERTALQCEATFAAFPAHDGELGVLLNRAPIVCKLGIGTMRVDTSTEKHTLFIDGGFAQVVGNRLTILTGQALAPGTIDRATVEQAMIEARALKITDDSSYTARAKAVTRAQVQLQLTKARARP
jgi:F-type H+-transporting ATPase subunit epsilon